MPVLSGGRIVANHGSLRVTDHAVSWDSHAISIVPPNPRPKLHSSRRTQDAAFFSVSMVSDRLFDGGGIEWSLASKQAANNCRSRATMESFHGRHRPASGRKVRQNLTLAASAYTYPMGIGYGKGAARPYAGVSSWL